MPTPDASQWNIGGVGPSGVGAGVGHVHFIFLCRFHLHLVPNANPISSGIWALRIDKMSRFVLRCTSIPLITLTFGICIVRDVLIMSRKC